MTFQSPALNHYTPSYYTANSSFTYPSDISQVLDSSQNTKTTPESYIQTSEVVILEPTSFSEVPSAVQILRNNQVVVLNLANMAKEEAQRSVDFIAGGAYMYQGSLEKIDIHIFLFTPRNTNIRVENYADQDMLPSIQEAQSQAPKAHFSSPVSYSFLVHQAS
jgi:FtsZ-interacting cell division protein YlmF